MGSVTVAEVPIERPPAWTGTDEELARLALAADRDLEPEPDAVPLATYLGAGDLPAWYMPPATARGGSRKRVAAVALVVASLLLIDGLGLCITYGQLVLA